MIPKRLGHLILMVALLMSTDLVCLPLAAESIEIPGEYPLNAASVLIDLWNADVDLVTDPTARATLRAEPATDGPTKARLDQTFTEGVLTIRRPTESSRPTEEGRPSRLKIDIVVGAQQNVHLMGQDLRVTTREIRHTGVTDPLGLQFTLESSELSMNGGQRTIVKARQTSVWLVDTRELADLTLESGTAELSNHQGNIKLKTDSAEITVMDLQGELEPLMIGGSLDMRGGSGRIAGGRADDAIVLLNGWRGVFNFTGADSTVEAYGTGDDSSPWKIDGTDLQVTIEDHIGQLDGQLAGGRWDGSSLGGTVTLTASRAAAVEFTDLAQGLVLKLSDQASARLTNLQWSAQVELREARLEATQIGALSLVATNSEVDIRQPQDKVDLTLTNSELELDLTTNDPSAEQHRSPSLNLLGAGRSRVSIEAPCEVRVEGDRDESYERIRVSGCMLQLPGQRAPTRGHDLPGNNRLMILTVTADSDADLEVEGQ